MPDSSPEAEVETAEVEQTGADKDVNESSAEASTAEDGQQKGDMLSAVKAALEPKENAPDSANQGSEKDSTEAADKEGGEGEDDSDDFSEEEKARLSQKAKRRFHKLANEVTSLTKERDELRPQAQQFQQVARFVADAGLSIDEVNRGFDIMAAVKQNPLRAYEMMTPLYEQLQQMVGAVLPNDLREAVDLGRISEAHARELARSRAAATLHEQRSQRIEQRSQFERQQNHVAGQWDGAARATTEWENSKAKSDPEWKLKQPRVVEILELDLLKRQRANPQFVPTQEQAVEMANEALKKVNDEFKRLRPKPKAVGAITDVGASPGAKTKPKTMLDAVEQGLAAARAG